jgi:hypothetical protein
MTHSSQTPLPVDALCESIAGPFFDNEPVSSDDIHLLADFIGWSVASTMAEPFVSGGLAKGGADGAMFASSADGGVHPLGRRCLCEGPSGSDPWSCTWDEHHATYAHIATVIAENVEAIYDHGKKLNILTLSEVKYALVLLERVLTSELSSVPFVLNADNFAMALLVALILSHKVLSTDRPLSNSCWAKIFGVDLGVLNSSEEFMLAKVQYQATVSEAENAAVDLLLQKLRNRYTAHFAT